MSLEKDTMYEMSFSPKELFYKLFHLKKCPICNEKLISVDEKHDLGYQPVNKAKFQRMSNIAKHYSVNFYYRCENCDLVFSLNELANWNDEGE